MHLSVLSYLFNLKGLMLDYITLLVIFVNSTLLMEWGIYLVFEHNVSGQGLIRYQPEKQSGVTVKKSGNESIAFYLQGVFNTFLNI